MKSMFPSAEMISDGEVRTAVAQTPNYTSHENGRPKSFAEMMKGQNCQGVGEQTVHGLEEIDYESPMYRGLMPKRDSDSMLPSMFLRDQSTSASVADDGYGSLPVSPMPKKVAW